MSDAMHVPLLVAHPYESHAAAGAIVGLATDALLRGHTSRGKRLLIAVGTALVIGTAKEYLVDHHARAWEIPPWGLGAAAALSFRYSF